MSMNPCNNMWIKLNRYHMSKTMSQYLQLLFRFPVKLWPSRARTPWMSSAVPRSTPWLLCVLFVYTIIPFFSLIIL